VSYVEVPTERLFSFLEEKGFSRTVRYSEVVYERKHDRDPRYKVLIYTSVREGRRKARGCGQDAIRVCAVFESVSELGDPMCYGVAKLPKVLRTGTVEAVLERTITRAREAYAVINKRVKNNKLNPS